MMLGAIAKAKKLGIELVPDPDFDSPAAWTIDQAFGVSIARGQLVINEYAGLSTSTYPSVALNMVEGVEYNYEIVVSQLDNQGGVLQVDSTGTTLWQVSDGIGTFTGTYTTDYGPYFNTITSFPGSVTFDRISIKEV